MFEKILDSKLIMISTTVLMLLLAGLIPQVSTWVVLGVLSHVFMMTYNFLTSKNEWVKVKKLYNKSGYLPFLRGVLVCLILGPTSILLFIYFKISK